MKVADLIAALSEFDPEDEVVVSHGELSGAYEVRRIYEIDDFICIEGDLSYNDD